MALYDLEPRPTTTTSPSPPATDQPRRARGPRLALFGLSMFLVGSLVGGVAGVGAMTWGPGFVAPQASPLATAAPTGAAKALAAPATDPFVAAVKEVLPAVVTVINRGSGGLQLGTGSGLIIDKDLGYVVTNSHVIELARSTEPAPFVDVVLSDGTRKRATVLGNDPSTDVAVLRVEGGGLPAQAALGDLKQVPLGSQVIAIGSPGISGPGPGAVLENSVTSGVVSGKGRSFPRADLRGNVVLRDLVQTDAPINPGNSGGPLVWVATRQVIGLNTLVVRGSGEEGLGFAVSSDTVRQIAAAIIAHGSAR